MTSQTHLPSETKIRAVVAGHICLDIIPGLNHLSCGAAQFFAPGKLLQTGPLSLAPGGCVSNTGLALLKLGIPTVLMGKFGDDPCGLLLRSLLERAGAGRGIPVVPGAETSSTVILSPGHYDRMFLHNPAANDTFGADDIDYDLVAGTSLFHLGYPPVLKRLCDKKGRELAALLCRVKALGVTTSLDMTMPDPATQAGSLDWNALLKNCLPYVDIFLPSAAELLFMLERGLYEEYNKQRPHDIEALVTASDASRLGSRLLALGCAAAGIKMGVGGFYLRTAGRERLAALQTGNGNPGSWAEREFWLPAYKAAGYAGATGAGDCAIAGFLAALLRGLGPDDCLRYAAAAGASNVTAPDALSGLALWPQLTTALHKGWEQHPLEVQGAGWAYRQDGIWFKS